MPDESARLRRQFETELEEIGRTVMPFGRLRGRHLHTLPAEYLASFQHSGWPDGRIGELMRIVYHTKVEGADCVFNAFRGRGIEPPDI